MTRPMYFGEAPRSLFGIFHPVPRPQGRPMLICPPLLQDGIRSHRALWALAEALVAAGQDVFRFDWYGSGDSGGESQEIDFPGLLADLEQAQRFIDTATDQPSLRVLAVRSSTLPVMTHAAAQTRPVDVVLWDPCVSGRELVAHWRLQHHQQLHEAGRYPLANPEHGDGELLGFEVSRQLLAALEAVDLRDIPLPAESRVRMAVWGDRPDQLRWIEGLRQAGVATECLHFETSDAPSFEDPNLFETLAFPRRSVTKLAAWISETARP